MVWFVHIGGGFGGGVDAFFLFIKASRHGMFVVRLFLKLFWFEFSMSFLLPVFLFLFGFCFTKPDIKTLDTCIWLDQFVVIVVAVVCCCSLTEFNTHFNRPTRGNSIMTDP